jgi:hypothetical protein
MVLTATITSTLKSKHNALVRLDANSDGVPVTAPKVAPVKRTEGNTEDLKEIEPSKYRIKIVAPAYFCIGVFLECLQTKFSFRNFDAVVFSLYLSKHRKVCVLRGVSKDVAETKVADVNQWLNLEQRCSCKSSLVAVAELDTNPRVGPEL